jgi:hypothetical protein
MQSQTPRYQSPINAPTPQVTLPVPTAITPNGQVVEDLIVQINDQIINRSDLERAEQQLQQDAQQAGASPAELADRQRTLLRDLIDQQLLISRGKEHARRPGEGGAAAGRLVRGLQGEPTELHHLAAGRSRRGGSAAADHAVAGASVLRGA